MLEYKCILCGRLFKQKIHLINHNNKKTPCVQIDMYNEYEKIKKELEIIKTENEKLKKELYELKNNKISDIVINENNVNNVNNVNINGDLNINFNVIKVIDHGKEDYTKIDIKKIMLDNQVLPNLNYISTIIYYVHCNNDFPEYQNVYISDMSRNKAMIYHDGKWISADKMTTLDNLYNSIVNHTDNIIENSTNPDNFSNYVSEIKKTNPFGNSYSKKYKKKVLTNSENVLYDNKDRIKSIKMKKPKIMNII